MTITENLVNRAKTTANPDADIQNKLAEDAKRPEEQRKQEEKSNPALQKE
jgi:hypothetical protein